MNLFDLTGKTALLVGYQGKLGPIWNETLQEAGAEVYGYGEPEVNFWGIAGGDINYVLDERLWDIRRQLRAPDIIVYNAAIDTPPTVTDARFFTDWHKTLFVNLVAPGYIIDFFVPNMIERGKGVIVLIGSIMGHRAADWTNYVPPFEKPVGYNCSKAGLRHLAPCLTRQYGHKGIRAVSISFGPVDTGKLSPEFLEKIKPKIPMRRPVSVTSLKQALLNACCCEDLAGTDVLVDGGFCT